MIKIYFKLLLLFLIVCFFKFNQASTDVSDITSNEQEGQAENRNYHELKRRNLDSEQNEYDALMKRFLKSSKKVANQVKTEDEEQNNEENETPSTPESDNQDEESSSNDDNNNNDEDNSNDGDNNNDDDDNNNKYPDFGEGIFVPLGGDVKINICEGQYIKMAEETHIKIKDMLIAACSGHSSAKWLIKKIAKVIFNKQL